MGRGVIRTGRQLERLQKQPLHHLQELLTSGVMCVSMVSQEMFVTLTTPAPWRPVLWETTRVAVYLSMKTRTQERVIIPGVVVGRMSTSVMTMKGVRGETIMSVCVRGRGVTRTGILQEIIKKQLLIITKNYR